MKGDTNMNKFLSRFSTALISLVLAVGIGIGVTSNNNAVRADAGTNLVAKALFGASYNQAKVSSYSSSFVTIVDGFSWNVANFNNNNSQWNYVKTGNKSSASVGTITTANQVSKIVTSAYLIIDSVTASNVNSIKLLAGDSLSNLSEVTSFAIQAGTQEVEIPSASQTANLYYEFSIDCKKSSNGIVTVSEAGLYSDINTTTSLSSISVGGSMTKTEYYLGESWDPTGLSVTATYASGSTASIDSSKVTWTYSPEKPALGVTSVTASAMYNGKTADSSAQTVTIFNEILFDFEARFSTYASDWGGYADHTLTSKDLGVTETSATINIPSSSKQGQTLTTMPVVKNSTITFTLDASETRVIDTVKVNFVQWTKKTQTISLYKGADISTAISNISFPSDGNSISASGLKSSSFTCITSNTSNQIGIKSIVVTLVESSFGTLDHISVSSLPNKTTYCVGEKFTSEGLVVTAYDGADEATASSKEVTDSITLLIDDGYVFNESNVSDPFVVDVEYTEGDVSKETSFDITVLVETNYELVTAAPNDWSGEYLVVTNNNEKLLGLNCSLKSPDVASNYVTLTATDNVIATNSSYSITIEKMEGGYSVKSTLHGYYIGGDADKNKLSTNKTVPYLNTITLNNDGSVALTSNTKSLAFNANLGDERFRYYGNGYLSVNLYRKAASSSVSDFADMFIDDLHCDATGVTAPSVDEWNVLKDIFADLDAYDQLTFKIAVGNPSGTNVEQAVAKYDYIITKYGVTNYVDFMGRVEYGSLTLANNRIEFADKLDSQSTIICVVVLTLLSVSTIGGYIILKKTKEN